MLAASWAPAKTYQTTGFTYLFTSSSSFCGSYKKIYVKKFSRNGAVSTGCLLANFGSFSNYFEIRLTKIWMLFENFVLY